MSLTNGKLKKTSHPLLLFIFFSFFFIKKNFFNTFSSTPPSIIINNKKNKIFYIYKNPLRREARGDMVEKLGQQENNFFSSKVMELTGINRKTLSGYENSVAEPDLDTFARLLRLYQLSADEVLELRLLPPPRIFSLSRANEKCLLFFQKFDTSHQEELFDSVSISRRLSR